MAEWWEAAPLVEQPAQKNWWESAPVVGEKPTNSYSGRILPFSVDAQGNKSFDINAGLTGAILQALSLPGDALTGKVPVRDEDGNLTDEFIGRSFEAAGVAAGVNPAIRIGDRGLPGPLKAQRPEPVPVPSAEELKAVGSAGYDALRRMDVQYPGDEVAAMASRIADELTKQGFIRENAPVTNRILRDLQGAPEGSFATPGTLDIARQSLQKIAPGTPDDAASWRAVDGLDAFLMGRDTPDAVAGTPAAILSEARGNYRAGKRSDDLTAVETRAERNADSTASGRNLGNSIRQRIASVLNNDRSRARFSPEQIQLLEGIVEGGPVANATRFAGNILGGGGGLGSVAAGSAGAAAGTLLGGPMGAAIGAAAVPASGLAARSISNRLTQRALNKADEAARKDSPLYRDRLAGANMEGRALVSKGAAIRAVIMSTKPAAEKAREIREILNEPEPAQ